MMNILAIGFVVSSLLTAAVWSPSPPPQANHDEMIVKHGHRVVTVEYDQKSYGNTKVSISPISLPDAIARSRIDSKHASDEDEPPERMFFGPKGVSCDDHGNCKRKIANAIDKTKDMVTKTAHRVTDKAHEIEEHAKDKLSVSENVPGESLSKVKKFAGNVMGTVKDGVSKTKNFDIVDSPKRIGEDIARNATGKIKETVKNVQLEMGEISVNEIVSKLKESAYDVIGYMLYRDKIGSVIGLVHMVGFSTAYGMCVWVTFVSSYVLGSYLPRQMFGLVQSRIYPVYFKAVAYCVVAALFAHLASRKSEVLVSKMGMFQSLCLVSALFMVLINMKLLEPKATKAMFEMMKIEKEEGRGVGVAIAAKDGMADGSGATVVKATSVVADRRDALRLNEKLKRLNAYSSALNLSTLVVLTWHMAYMGQLLQAAP